MAKRQKLNQISASFHYLVKSLPAEIGQDPREEGFSAVEYARLVERIRNTAPLDERNEDVIEAIKAGVELPFLTHAEVENGLHFGSFEGAYYGQRYRNNRLGVIEAESLNLRPFFYLVTRLRDGRILIGVTYHGRFGDYDGIRSCFSHLLRGSYKVGSKTIKSISAEIGNGVPVSIRLVYRRANDRPERAPIFGSSGAIAIASAEIGEGFQEQVNHMAARVVGPAADRRRLLADLVREGDIIELDEDEIVSCSIVVRESGRTRTVYLLGDNNFSTKFPLNVNVDRDGVADADQVLREMTRVMRERVIPLIA